MDGICFLMLFVTFLFLGLFERVQSFAAKLGMAELFEASL